MSPAVSLSICLDDSISLGMSHGQAPRPGASPQPPGRRSPTRTARQAVFGVHPLPRATDVLRTGVLESGEP